MGEITRNRAPPRDVLGESRSEPGRCQRSRPNPRNRCAPPYSSPTQRSRARAVARMPAAPVTLAQPARASCCREENMHLLSHMSDVSGVDRKRIYRTVHREHLGASQCACLVPVERRGVGWPSTVGRPVDPAPTPVPARVPPRPRPPRASAVWMMCLRATASCALPPLGLDWTGAAAWSTGGLAVAPISSGAASSRCTDPGISRPVSWETACGGWPLVSARPRLPSAQDSLHRPRQSGTPSWTGRASME